MELSTATKKAALWADIQNQADANEKLPHRSTK